MRVLPLAALAVPLAAQLPAPVGLKLPPLLSDHAVWQRGVPVRLWGTTAPQAEVRATTSWGHEASSRADDGGAFELVFQPAEAPGPHEVTIASAGDSRTIRDVLFGEVWLCGGQSNMEWTLGPGVGKGIKNWEAEVAAADFPTIRMFDVPNRTAASPQSECAGEWRVCTPANAGTFSAVAYFFGRDLHRALDVPVGLITSCQGGTLAQAWTPERDLGGFRELERDLAKVKEARAVPAALDTAAKALPANLPAVLYNGMIAPLVRVPVRGVTFYQGEANVDDPLLYRRLFPALIASWRDAFAKPDLPFYYVQIAPFEYGGQRSARSAFLREAQALAMQQCAHTGMVVTMDVGDPRDIHPLDKQTVGARLARWALRDTYGKSDVFACGPTLAGHEVAGDAIRLRFTHAAGLTTSDGKPPSHFTVAGDDRVFHPAEATIDGDAIVVRCAAVPRPAAARYAFGAADMPNLVNGAGLPASSFRTDDWPPP